MKLSIYSIPGAVRAALDAVYIDEETGEIVGYDDAAAVCAASEDALAGAAKWIKELQANVAAMKAAEKEIYARRKAAEKLAERLTDMTATGLRALGVERVEAPDIAVRFAKNPPAVQIFDQAQVPAEFWTQPEPPAPAIDKAAIKAAIKAGQTVPGATLEQSVRLVIK